jgi:hypothetical protein
MKWGKLSKAIKIMSDKNNNMSEHQAYYYYVYNVDVVEETDDGVFEEVNKEGWGVAMSNDFHFSYSEVLRTLADMNEIGIEDVRVTFVDEITPNDYMDLMVQLSSVEAEDDEE